MYTNSLPKSPPRDAEFPKKAVYTVGCVPASKRLPRDADRCTDSGMNSSQGEASYHVSNVVEGRASPADAGGLIWRTVILFGGRGAPLRLLPSAGAWSRRITRSW